jgi:hypothetical protein
MSESRDDAPARPFIRDLGTQLERIPKGASTFSKDPRGTVSQFFEGLGEVESDYTHMPSVVAPALGAVVTQKQDTPVKKAGAAIPGPVGTFFSPLVDLFSMSDFEKFGTHVRSLPGIRLLEEDRYYKVFYYPKNDTTYIEWLPTEDVMNLRVKTGSVAREWSEDFLAAAGFRIPAWSKRVKYIKDKYGKEGEKVKHYGYSRGGGLATHMGGTGYGTGYFSSYMPSKGYKSKWSGDKLHDYLINPLSYSLLQWSKIH